MQAEIDSLLSGAGLTSEDEEAVQAELDALMATEESSPSPIIDSRLPTVPTTDPSETSMDTQLTHLFLFALL